MRKLERIYIIHIEPMEGELFHYIGYTTRRLLSKRLEEHRNNPRSPERRDAIRNAKLVRIEAIDERGNIHKEVWYKACPEWLLRQEVCPICAKLRLAGFEIENGRDPEAPPASSPPEETQHALEATPDGRR